MHQTADINPFPNRATEHTQFAQDWWHGDAFQLLPGEADDHTVYAIDFYDRCKHFGYTKGSVFHRAASLAAKVGSWDTNRFVEEHAARVPYAIRCIKSGLNDLQARRLRDALVAQAPENILAGRGNSVQTDHCWLLRHTDLNSPMAAIQSLPTYATAKTTQPLGARDRSRPPERPGPLFP